MNLMLHGFAHPLAFLLLASLPILSAVAFFSARRRRKALAQFGHSPLLGSLIATRRGLAFVRNACFASGVALMCAGVAGPRWGRDWQNAAAPVRDVAVVLDMSQSMLAEAPSRFERSKTALIELSRTLQGRGGVNFLAGGVGTDTVVESSDVNFVLTNTSLTGPGQDTLSSIEQGRSVRIRQ